MREIEALNLGKLTKIEKERRTGAILVRPFVCTEIVALPNFDFWTHGSLDVWSSVLSILYPRKISRQKRTAKIYWNKGSSFKPVTLRIFSEPIYIYIYRSIFCSSNTMSTPWSLALPRCYPAGFGYSLRQVWETHLGALPARRELRFKPQINEYSTPLQQFESLPINDLWEDAKLYEPLAYSSQNTWGGMDVCFFES